MPLAVSIATGSTWNTSSVFKSQNTTTRDTHNFTQVKSHVITHQIPLQSSPYLDVLTDVGGDDDVKKMKKKHPIKSTERDVTGELSADEKFSAFKIKL